MLFQAGSRSTMMMAACLKRQRRREGGLDLDQIGGKEPGVRFCQQQCLEEEYIQGSAALWAGRLDQLPVRGASLRYTTPEARGEVQDVLRANNNIMSLVQGRCEA